MHLKKFQRNIGLTKFLEAPYLYRQSDPQVATIIGELDLKKDSIVLDFGAGDGRFTLPIADQLKQMGEKGLVFGFDYSTTLINRLDDLAAEQGLDVVVRPKQLPHNDPCELPINDSSVDRILACNSAHYLVDPVPIYEEFYRILKPEGVLLIADWQDLPRQASKNDSRELVAPEQVQFDLMVAGFDPPGEINSPDFSWMIRARGFPN